MADFAEKYAIDMADYRRNPVLPDVYIRWYRNGCIPVGDMNCAFAIKLCGSLPDHQRLACCVIFSRCNFNSTSFPDIYATFENK